MFVARIAGTVVCTRKVPELEGFKFLVAKKLDLDGKPTGDHVVAVDAVGAGHAEQVLIVSGSSARQTQATTQRPVDAAVVGIVDDITLSKEKGTARRVGAGR